MQLLYIQELETESSETLDLDLVKVYVMADKYKCPDAAEMARKLATPALRATLAKTTVSSPEAANRSWDSYTESISYLYNNIPSRNDRLKKDTARAAAAAWRFLRSRTGEQISTFLKEVPDFAIALASSESLFSDKERCNMGTRELDNLMKSAQDS